MSSAFTSPGSAGLDGDVPNVIEHPRVRTEPWRPGPLGSLWLLELVGRSERSAAWLVAENKTEHRYLLLAPAAPFLAAEPITRWATTIAATAAVRHPALARSVRAGHHGGRPYLLYDLAEWRPFAEHVHRAAVMPSDALKLAADAAGALGALHGAALLHGDLQPWCVLVSHDGRRCVLAGAGVASVANVTAAATHTAKPLDPDFTAEVSALSAVLANGLAAVPSTGSLGPHAPEQPLSELVWPTAADAPDAPDASNTPEAGGGTNPARLLAARLASLRDRVAADGRAFLEALAARIAECGPLPALLDPDDPEDVVLRLLGARLDDAAAIVSEDVALTLAVLSQASELMAAGNREADPRAVPSLPNAIALLGVDRVLATARAMRSAVDLPGHFAQEGSHLLAALRLRARGAVRAAAHLRLPGSPEHLARLSATLQSLGLQVVAFHAPRAARLIDRRTGELLAKMERGKVAPGIALRMAALAVVGVDPDQVTSLSLRLTGAPPGLQQLALRWSSDEPARWRSATQVMSLCGSLANDLADLCHLLPDMSRLDDDRVDALAWKYVALLDEHPVPAPDLLQAAFELCRDTRQGQELPSMPAP